MSSSNMKQQTLTKASPSEHPMQVASTLKFVQQKKADFIYNQDHEVKTKKERKFKV